MPDPDTADEFEQRFKSNSRLTGWGFANVVHEVPCPFCGAAGWGSWKVVDNLRADHAPMTRSRRCAECGRSGRFAIGSDGGSLSVELVQTGGPNPPDWMVPPLREQ